jgi:hypothetical protein
MTTADATSINSQHPMSTLPDIMNGEFANAKVCFRAVAGLQWVIAGAAVLAIATDCRQAMALPLALIGFLGPLAAFLLRELGAHYMSKGERVRRLYMLQRGLGREPSEADLMDIHAHGATRSAREAKPIGSYYSAGAETGVPQLLLQLEESAFWTASLARLTAVIHYVIAGIGLVATSAITLVVLWTPAQSAAVDTVDFSRLFASLLLFFVAGTTMSSARSYHSLAAAAAKVIEKAANLRGESAADPIELYKILSAYDSVLAKSPPIPGYVYRLRQKRLQAAWDTAHGRGPAGSDGAGRPQ